MKSRTYTLILSGTLGSSILAFGACSSNTGQDSSGTDQVESALASVGPIQCRRAIRECADKSCANEIRAVLTSFPFSPRQLLAINALTECAVENCANACTAGTGGAAGAGGAPGTGGAAGSGGVATGGAAGGGGIATGGAAGGGGVATGGAAGSGGVATGGAAGAGGVATGGGGGVDAGVGGATATGGNAGAGGASTGGATGAGGMTGGGVDLNGTWISHVNTPGTISAPIVGSTAANIDIVLRLFVSESASTLTGTVEICRLNPVTTPNASSLVVTFSPAVLATLNTTVTEPAFTAMVGQPVPLPPVTILTGEDAMGSSVDSDVDGHPGVTIPSNVGGLIMLNAYTGLKITTTLTATLTDPTTIGGTTSFASTGTVFGSDNAILTSGSIDVTPSSNSIPFTATKLAGNVPCSQVLTMF